MSIYWSGNLLFKQQSRYHRKYFILHTDIGSWSLLKKNKIAGLSIYEQVFNYLTTKWSVTSSKKQCLKNSIRDNSTPSTNVEKLINLRFCVDITATEK